MKTKTITVNLSKTSTTKIIRYDDTTSVNNSTKLPNNIVALPRKLWLELGDDDGFCGQGRHLQVQR